FGAWGKRRRLARMLNLIHLTATVKIPTLEAMEVHFPPDLEQKLHDLAVDTRRGADELVQDAVAGFVDESAAMRGMIESRYDDLKSGRVKPSTGNKPSQACARKAETAGRFPDRLRA